jgi:hypothetical protein
MEISFVTSKNVNGKEVQAFGGYGFSDWKFHGQRQKFYICWWGPWLIPTVRYNRWVMPCWSCLFEGEAKEANFDVSVRSRPGDVGQWFDQTKLRPCHVEISSRDTRKEERSKHYRKYFYVYMEEMKRGMRLTRPSPRLAWLACLGVEDPINDISHQPSVQ